MILFKFSTNFTHSHPFLDASKKHFHKRTILV
nr:MAG TPA: hypothetical protein [Caudoviricetes sp.]